MNGWVSGGWKVVGWVFYPFIQYKAVCEDTAVGGMPVDCHTGEQGGLEPATVLV